MDRQCKKKQQTIYIWTDSAKKQQTIYIWTDSAKKKQQAIYIWTDSAKKTTNNLHMIDSRLVEQQIDVQRCNRLFICSVVDVHCMVSSDSR